MKHYFSQSTMGFYSDEDDVKNIPSDVIEVTNQQRLSAVDAWNNNGATLNVVDGELVHIPIDINKAKGIAKSNLNKSADIFINAATSKYPKFEKITFSIQRDEAMAWEKSNSTKTPNIDIISINRGVDRVDLIHKILKNVKSYQAIAMAVVGKRQKYEDQIKSAATVEDVNNLIFDFNI